MTITITVTVTACPTLLWPGLMGRERTFSGAQLIVECRFSRIINAFNKGNFFAVINGIPVDKLFLAKWKGTRGLSLKRLKRLIECEGSFRGSVGFVG